MESLQEIDDQISSMLDEVLGVDPVQAQLQQIQQAATAWQAQVQAAGFNVNLNTGAIGQPAGSAAINAVIAQAQQAGNNAVAQAQAATTAYNTALQQAQQGGYPPQYPGAYPPGSNPRAIFGDDLIGDYTSLPALATAAQNAGQAALSAATAGQALPTGSDASAWLATATAAINAANQAATAAQTAAAAIPPASPFGNLPYGGGYAPPGGGYGGGGGDDGGGFGGGDPGDPGNIDWGDGSSSDAGGASSGDADTGDTGDTGDGVDWGTDQWAAQDAAATSDSDYGSSDNMMPDDSSDGSDVMGNNPYIVGALVLSSRQALPGTLAKAGMIRGDDFPVLNYYVNSYGTRFVPGTRVSLYPTGTGTTPSGSGTIVDIRQMGQFVQATVQQDNGQQGTWPLEKTYLLSTSISGDDVRTIPSAGSSASSTAPVVYTDAKTVAAVQSALVGQGYNIGSTGPNGDGVDGEMGPKTRDAIKKVQATSNWPQTGKIDQGVLQALKVTPGVLPPGVTVQGRAAVQAQVALDAATLAEHSVTPQQVQVAAAQVVDAAPAAPPELVATVQRAKAAAASATTPAQVAAAKQQVQNAALQVHAAVSPGWWQTPLWAGAPVKRWQGAAGLAGGLAVVTGLAFALRHR